MERSASISDDTTFADGFRKGFGGGALGGITGALSGGSGNQVVDGMAAGIDNVAGTKDAAKNIAENIRRDPINPDVSFGPSPFGAWPWVALLAVIGSAALALWVIHKQAPGIRADMISTVKAFKP